MAELIFKRSEQKYLLDAGQTAVFRQAMARYMQPGQFPTASIRNIYYDTADFRLIRRSLEKPVYKEKLRLRSYGDISEDDTVFLEMKKKFQGVVYKRRLALPYREAAAYMADPALRLDDTQVGRELDYFKTFYGALQPALYMSYDRWSWCSNESDLRVTLDQNICFRREQMDLTASTGGTELLQPGQALVEIKASGAMPLWLAQLLSREMIRQISFSKYGTAYLRLLKEHKIDCRGFQYV